MTTENVKALVGDSFGSQALPVAMDDLTTLGGRLRYARRAAHLTQDDVADDLGIKRPSVSLWETGDAKPEPGRFPRLAELYATTVDWLMTGRGEPPAKRAKVERRQETESIPEQRLAGFKNLPVYAAAMGGEGHIIVTFDAIDFVRRPAPLENVKNGYGILVVGRSMVPKYYPGDIALVHPFLQPEPEKGVVLYHTPPIGEAEAMIKLFVAELPTKWRLKQLSPKEEEFEVDKIDWPIIHRIVGSYDRR